MNEQLSKTDSGEVFKLFSMFILKVCTNVESLAVLRDPTNARKLCYVPTVFSHELVRMPSRDFYFLIWGLIDRLLRTHKSRKTKLIEQEINLFHRCQVSGKSNDQLTNYKVSIMREKIRVLNSKLYKRFVASWPRLFLLLQLYRVISINYLHARRQLSEFVSSFLHKDFSRNTVKSCRAYG